MGTYPASYNYIPFDAIDLDWDKITSMFSEADGTNECMLVALDWRSISTLISVLRFAEYWHLWGLPGNKAFWSETERQRWHEISAHIAELEVCLMSGCSVSDLIKTNRMIVAAITGEPDDLTAPLPDDVDFGGISVSDRLKDVYDKIGTLDVTVSTGLTAVKEAIATQSGGAESLEDDLQNIKLAIEAIALIAAA